jgi:uncharacterized membrane protein
MKQKPNNGLRLMAVLGAGQLCAGAASQAPALPPGLVTLNAGDGRTSTLALHVNNLGQIVGIVTIKGDARHNSIGFLLSHGRYTSVQPPAAVGGGSVETVSLNDRGQIVGSYRLRNGQKRSFLMDHGRYTEIAFPQAAYTQAFGINNAGDVVGIYGDDTNVHGFLCRQGAFKSIDLPNMDVVNAFGINDKDQIVGQCADKAGRSHGFLLDHGVRTWIDFPKAADTIPHGINDKGQIVGADYLRGQHGNGSGFLWSHGTFTRIDSPSGTDHLYPISINDRGEIVGNFEDKKEVMHGFLRSRS